MICGPTSAGKSSIALGVAQRLGGEIINADSRQIYRSMNVGTGAPPPEAFKLVPHHLYGIVEPRERYSAARFVNDARAAIDDICSRGRLPIVVGGTGFYIEALVGTMPLDRPPADDELRARLGTEARIHPSEVLWEWLRALDPRRAEGVGRGDRYRILRALEGVLSGRTQRGPQRKMRCPPVRFAIVVLRLPRETLRSRIGSRVSQMFDSGLVGEALAVRAIAVDAPALSGLGYAQALALWDGLATAKEARGLAVRKTTQYAKRQETWFRRLRTAVVIDALDQDEAIASIESYARERLSTT